MGVQRVVRVPPDGAPVVEEVMTSSAAVTTGNADAPNPAYTAELDALPEPAEAEAETAEAKAETAEAAPAADDNKPAEESSSAAPAEEAGEMMVEGVVVNSSIMINF